MNKEFLVFSLDIFTEIRVVRCVVANGIRCVFGFESLESE